MLDFFTNDASAIAFEQPVGNSFVMRLTPGRSLTLSPQWSCSDARVVYDRNSGDYWVVSLLAAMALEQFEQQAVLTFEQLNNRLEYSQIYADLHAALALTVQSLIENELLQNANHTIAGVDGLK